MKKQKSETARQVAMRDITADCKKRKDGQNYIPYEKDICAYAEVEKGDFRQFNGGHNKKR